MKTVLSILSLSFLTSASLLAQGQLAPTAAPAPTMKSLDQIEPRRPLIAGTAGVAIAASGTITISLPGSYYLTGNLTVTSGNGITITSSDVTLDLGGYTIASTNNGGQGVGLSGGISRVSIYNGHIKGNYAYSGGAFTGSGLGSGIDFSAGGPIGVRVKDVTVDGVGNYGIDLGINETSIVESCVVRVANIYGIRAGIVTDSAALLIGNDPILATTAINSIGKRADGTPNISNPNSPQADQRVPISSLPYTVEKSGSYYLTKNLSISTGNGIIIDASDVTLDLNGFTISSITSPNSGSAITASEASFSGITIRNGGISSGVSASGFTGPGFDRGINLTAAGVLVENIRVKGVKTIGINLPDFSEEKANVVRNCSVDIASQGIVANVVIDCDVKQTEVQGIYAKTVSHCYARCISTNNPSQGITASIVDSSEGIGVGGIFAAQNGTVSNSRGIALGATGFDKPGIEASIVSNSYGSNSGSADGITAYKTALNCFGFSANADGVDASTGVATNCFGEVSNTSAGVGLRAFTANGSRGLKNGAISQVITNKYNMP